MGVFDFFAGKKGKAGQGPSRAAEEEETLQKCPSCGSFFRISFRFCPYCGRQSDLYKNGAETKGRSAGPGSADPLLRMMNEEALSRLKEAGRSDQARKVFQVRISLPQRRDPVTIQLYGASTSGDAIMRLDEERYLRHGMFYSFTDWPEPACVCELEDRVYHLAETPDIPFAELYGCPNVFELSRPVPEKTIEVIEYDE